MALDQDILKKIKEKYEAQGEDPNVYLKGLLHQKPVNYWEYIDVETLLSLQRTKTGYHDETVFIVYHQITELVLKLMIHELKVLTGEKTLPHDVMVDKLSRLNRYTSMLINSFAVMTRGMSYEDYNEFRLSLAPASGFQSAQFRLIELYCTDMKNLIHDSVKKDVPPKAGTRELFDYLYWQQAGYDRKTGKKSLMLRQFEDKYLDEFVELAERMKTRNLDARSTHYNPENPEDKKVINALRVFDRSYNIDWPIVHLETANTYLAKKGAKKRATGSSDWQKYLHPAYQRRKFFPKVWSSAELENWAKDRL